MRTWGQSEWRVNLWTEKSLRMKIDEWSIGEWRNKAKRRRRRRRDMEYTYI